MSLKNYLQEKKSPIKDRYSSFLKNKKSREPKQNIRKGMKNHLLLLKEIQKEKED